MEIISIRTCQMGDFFSEICRKVLECFEICSFVLSFRFFCPKLVAPSRFVWSENRWNRSYPRNFSAVWNFSNKFSLPWTVNHISKIIRELNPKPQKPRIWLLHVFVHVVRSRGKYFFSKKKIKRPKNHKDNSDFNDFWTKRIVSAQPLFWKVFERTKRTKRFRKIQKKIE